MLFFPLINVKMPTIVGILTFMSRKKFMLSSVEHEKRLMTSGPVPYGKFAPREQILSFKSRSISGGVSFPREASMKEKNCLPLN